MLNFLIVAIWFNSQSVGYWPEEEDHPIIQKCDGRYVVRSIKKLCP
jgi:hypothetical protein